MAPLVFRPAVAGDTTDSADTNGIVDKHKTLDVTDNVDMIEDEDIDQSLLEEQLRQQESERATRLQAKNRRKRYLEVHPEYFSDSSLELADPLLYDRLIRRFQSPSEREAEGRLKGFSGTMATDLWRVEAKKAARARPDPHSLFTYNRGSQGQIMQEEKDEVPMTKEEGRKWWMDEMTQRFLRGEDEDFDYEKIGAIYDDPEEERDLQDKWFESMDSDFDSDGEGKEKILTGETGIQDY